MRTLESDGESQINKRPRRAQKRSRESYTVDIMERREVRRDQWRVI
jgi:hypothetical protein